MNVEPVKIYQVPVDKLPRSNLGIVLDADQEMAGIVEDLVSLDARREIECSERASKLSIRHQLGIEINHQATFLVHDFQVGVPRALHFS